MWRKQKTRCFSLVVTSSKQFWLLFIPSSLIFPHTRMDSPNPSLAVMWKLTLHIQRASGNPTGNNHLHSSCWLFANWYTCIHETWKRLFLFHSDLRIISHSSSYVLLFTWRLFQKCNIIMSFTWIISYLSSIWSLFWRVLINPIICLVTGTRYSAWIL